MKSKMVARVFSKARREVCRIGASGLAESALRAGSVSTLAAHCKSSKDSVGAVVDICLCQNEIR